MRKSVELWEAAHTLLTTLIQEAEMNPDFHTDLTEAGETIDWPTPEECTQIGVVFTDKNGNVWPMNFYRLPSDNIESFKKQHPALKGH